MKKVYALLLIVLFCRPCFTQVIKSFSHPSGYGLSATSARLLDNGYLVASKYDDGIQLVNYVTRYHNDGTVSWTKAEQGGVLSGIADMAENSRKELYFLCEDFYGDQHYGLIKTDSMGNVIWSRDLQKNGLGTYDAPRIKINAFDEIYIMSSTTEKTHLYKLDDAGTFQWSKTIEIDTVKTKNPAFGLETTPDGGLICSGKAGDDIFMLRFATDGTLIWAKRMMDNGLSYSHPKNITRLQDGNYLVTGFRGETVSPYASGLFLLKTDINGTVLDYKFYTDSIGQYGFIPYAAYEMSNGSIRVMGCGGLASFADFDANLNLERYSVWDNIMNFMVSANCFDYRNNQLVATGTDNNTTQYILRNSLDLPDFCDQMDIYTINQLNLPINNNEYNTTPVITKGPGSFTASYTLVSTGSFSTTTTCGQSELTLGITEEENTGSINVYPNPVSNGQALNLDLSWDDETHIMMMNAEGRLVLQQTTRGYHPTLSTDGLPAGMYFLSVSVNEKAHSTTKIIVY